MGFKFHGLGQRQFDGSSSFQQMAKHINSVLIKKIKKNTFLQQ